MTVRLCECRRRLWGSAVERKLCEILAMKFDPWWIELKIMADQIRSVNQSVAELEKTIADEGSKLRASDCYF
jgi:hypothetical protein